MPWWAFGPTFFFAAATGYGPVHVTVFTIIGRRSWSNGQMKTKHLIVGATALLLTAGSGVFADGIYKWTDENGTVHYGDRPTGEATEEQLQISYSRTNPEALENRVKSFEEREESRREARAEAEEKKREAEEERIAADEKLAECQTYQASLNKMIASPRVYRTNEAGERVYLDDAQREQSIARAEALVNEACSS